MVFISFFRLILDALFPTKAPRIPSIEMLMSAFSPESMGGICALFPYKHTSVKRAVWRLKYNADLRAARIFGEVMYSFLLEELADTFLFQTGTQPFSEPIIIPLPASLERMQMRGFNQCQLLTDVLKQFSCASFEIVENILSKPSSTREQKTLSRADRAKNLRGSFVISDPISIRNRDVILIDDVMTTGATLAEARATLMRAGARSVSALTIAH